MVDVTTTAAKLVGKLSAIASQVPFATSRALNQTARDVQAEEIAHFEDALTLRSDWWRPGRKTGINARFSSKTNLEARVFNAADWTVRHEEGSERVPGDGRRNVVVATVEHRGTPEAKLARSKRPAQLLRKPGYFFATSRRSGTKGIWHRPKKGGKMRLVFSMQPTAKGKKRINFQETGQEVAGLVFEKNFDTAFAAAVASARG
jgi:hypothetical protein